MKGAIKKARPFRLELNSGAGIVNLSSKIKKVWRLRFVLEQSDKPTLYRVIPYGSFF